MSEVQITKQVVEVDQTSTKVTVDLSLNAGPVGSQGVQGPAGPAGPTGPAGTYTPISPITITGTQIGLDTSKVVMIQPSSTQTIQGSLNINQNITSGGQLQLTGQGSNYGIVLGTDTVLYRSGADTIRTDDMVYIYRPTSGQVGLALTNTTSGSAHFAIQNIGKMEWGPGSTSRDTFLYRNNVNELKTDGQLTAASVNTSGDITVGGNLNVTGAVNEVTVDTLKVTDKTITVASGASSSSLADGAGVIAGTYSGNPSILWSDSSQRWISNKTIAANVVGNLTGNVTGNADTATTASGVTSGITITSPTLAGTPKSVTASSDDNSTNIATTAWVLDQKDSSTNPVMDGTASPGTGTRFALSNHIHPTDTTLAPKASPTFSGTVTITPLSTAGFVKNDSSGQLSSATIISSNLASYSSSNGYVLTAGETASAAPVWTAQASIAAGSISAGSALSSSTATISSTNKAVDAAAVGNGLQISGISPTQTVEIKTDATTNSTLGSGLSSTSSGVRVNPTAVPYLAQGNNFTAAQTINAQSATAFEIKNTSNSTTALTINTSTFAASNINLIQFGTGSQITGATFNNAGLTMNGSSSGSTILKASATASGTLSLPAETGTLVSTGSMTSNSPGFFCRPQDSTTSTATFTHNNSYFVRFTCPSLITVTKIWVNVGGTAPGTGSYLEGAIYSSSGSQLVTTGLSSNRIDTTATGNRSGTLSITLYPGVSYLAAIWAYVASGTLTLATITPPAPYWTYNTSISNAIGFNQNNGASFPLQNPPTGISYLTSGLPLIAFSAA